MNMYCITNYTQVLTRIITNYKFTKPTYNCRKKKLGIKYEILIIVDRKYFYITVLES